MFEKFKKLFKSNKKAVSEKKLDKLNDGLTIEDILRYKNLIPNLLDEFILDKNELNHRKSNSFNKKNTKLTLSENKLVHSNSGLLFKIKKKMPKKQAPVRFSIGRHYFLGSIEEENKRLTSKNVRRGSFTEKKDELVIVKEEASENNNENKEQNEKDNSSPKRKLKRKNTIDPQDTVEANNIQFEIRGKEEEIKEAKDKLEEYIDKTRKTQLKLYVFIKMTNYKSSLRRCFQRYRNTIKIMGDLDKKDQEIKENQKKRISLLKNLVKNRAFKENKEMNKYFLRFYYNCKYAAGMANLNEKLNKNKEEEKDSSNQNIKSEINNNEIKNTENKTEEKKEEINNNINTNTNFLNTLKGEIKKEEEKKELTPEEIEKARRKKNKELRDLFYNKVRERQKWLHDHFVKFYYKGLLWAMKTGNIRNNTSSPSETTQSNNSNQNTAQVKDNTPSTNTTTVSNDNNLINKTSAEIETININKEIEKKEEQKKEEEKKAEPKKEEEEKKEEVKKDKKANRMRDRSKGLRKLLSERNKEKTNILRKYFFKFLSNGILLSLKKTTLKSSKTLSKIIEDPEKKDDEDSDKKEEEEENNWIAEERRKKKLEEEQKQKELMLKKAKLLIKIFNKKDQTHFARQRSCLQKWNLRAKILAIADLNLGFKKHKKGKGKKKKKDKNIQDKNEN